MKWRFDNKSDQNLNKILSCFDILKPTGIFWKNFVAITGFNNQSWNYKSGTFKIFLTNHKLEIALKIMKIQIHFLFRIGYRIQWAGRLNGL